MNNFIKHLRKLNYSYCCVPALTQSSPFKAHSFINADKREVLTRFRIEKFKSNFF